MTKQFGPDWRTLSSALLLAAALPPFDFEILIWVALIPFLHRLRSSTSYRDSVFQGFWLSFSMGIAIAHWLTVAAHEFLSVSWPVSLLVLFTFAATCVHPQWMLFAALFRRATRDLSRTRQSPLAPLLCVALALGYAGLDWIVPNLFDVGIGYALHDASYIRQIADLGGVSLLTFVVVLVNLLLARIIEIGAQFRRPIPETWFGFAILVSILAASTFYGRMRVGEATIGRNGASGALRVAMVQGNVQNSVRLQWARGDDAAADKQLDTYLEQTAAIITRTEQPDIIIWPEATFPGVFQKPGSRPQIQRSAKFDRQVLRLNIPIIFGAYDAKEEEGRFTLFNGLFSITPNYGNSGRMGFVQRYYKSHLLAFAEYIPGISRMDIVRRYLPSVGQFGRGSGAEVMLIHTPSGGSVTLGPVICSESLDAQHVIDGARLGSEVIVNIGSDGWFGSFGEPQFHLAISKFRSIETRRPQLRVANTGISALILSDGSVAQRSELGRTEVLDVEVPMYRGRETWMVRFGDWFGLSALLLSVLLIPACVTMSKNEPQ